MTHYGLLCPPTTGHLNPMLALGRELQQQGHQVTLFNILDTAAKAKAAEINFWPLGRKEFPLGTLGNFYDHLGTLRGLAAFQTTLNFRQQVWATVFLQEAPVAIQAAGVEALLVDHVVVAGGAIAERLSLPFVSLCSALLMQPDASVPPFFAGWPYDPAPWAWLRNRFGHALLVQYWRMVHQPVNEYRQMWRLPLYRNPSDALSPLAQISHQPAEFEYPRQYLASYFHFTGPFHSTVSRETVSFPFEKLTGQPLIYSSMGTLRNRSHWVFEQIAAACVGLDAQLVIALGKGLVPEALGALPGDPIVVGYAPQLELLQRATLAITHAGLNTALESLQAGVPMVALPVTDDQPGVAARIKWTGAGEVVPKSRLTTARLRTAVQQVLTCETYKQNAVRLQQAIAQAGGVTRAADIVERAIATGKPVLTQDFSKPKPEPCAPLFNSLPSC
ncbi:glycosyltransferase [Trichocoleus sp. FACHB-591]|uniref:glycosyltransferase n=1 Tax=Trichocoleus sp. FACHB-591 TaxID=2692872 RepID=UPI00168351C6|nr:glycosyltransferase [Trichocoleus sp. FACHB-591]MBD2093859.1 glycosyltransferase [Trichocoleus sp. FACHB-591]